jgi:hypothetical protein
MPKDIKVRVVSDQACPKCGAIWGHTDKSLDFPNRPKVSDDKGRGWWKCYNPECDVNYYLPETGEVDCTNLTEVDVQRIKKEIDQYFVKEMTPPAKWIR